jgi:hypothetical protein
MATIGSLSVNIDANTTGLSAGLTSAEKQTKQFQAQLGALGDKLKVVGPLAAAAGAAFAVGMVKSVADAADALGDLSERTGIAVEDLSRLQYVAQLSGSSAEGMNAAIIKLSKGMADGNPAFEAMGVAVKNADGSLRSQSDVLNDVADKFSTYRDGTAKTALAMQLFGKSGAEMVGVLNQGSRGIKELSDESDRLGNTISTKTAKEAARFNDNLDKMSIATGGIARTISGPLIEALADLTGGLFEAYMQGETLFGSFERGFKRMAQAKDINTARERVEELQLEYDKVMKSMAHLEPWEQASYGAMTLAKRLDEAKARYSELTQLSENFRGAGFKDPRAVGEVPDDKGNAPDVAAADAAKKAADERDKQRADELAKIRQNEIDKANAFIDALHQKEEARLQSTKTAQQLEKENYTLEQEKLLESLNLGVITKSQYQVLELEALMRHREAMADIDSQYLTDQLAREQQNANERKNLQQQVADHAVQVQQDQTQRIINLLNMLGGKNKIFSLAAIALQTKTAFVQNKVATALAGNLAFASQIIPGDPTSLARANAAKAYALSQGAVTGSLILAAGAVQAAGVFGALGGGGGGGGGGAGGGFSSAGSVGGGTSMGGTMAAAPAQGQTVTIQLQGDVFGREQVRSLITQINEAVADGSVLRIA